jgi:hypothetical protein
LAFAWSLIRASRGLRWLGSNLNPSTEARMTNVLATLT